MEEERRRSGGLTSPQRSGEEVKQTGRRCDNNRGAADVSHLRVVVRKLGGGLTPPPASLLRGHAPRILVPDPGTFP